MELHTSLLILNLSVLFLLLHWYVYLTLKYSVPDYGKHMLFCIHFNRVPCEIKETKNNNFSLFLHHLLLSCFHILYELALEQNADDIRCFFFVPYGRWPHNN
jgi:hypothetical protein